jgi:hypothetical protein
MNGIGDAREDLSPGDAELVGRLGVLLDELDPPPDGLMERVQFAIALEDLDVEVARWERPGTLAGVRGTDQGTITFTVSDLTVMINLTRLGRHHRIDGWLVPAGEYGVEVRVAEHGSSSTMADEGGRIVIVVHFGATAGRRTVVTPTVVL